MSLTKLSKTILQVAGGDTTSFLNGLVTTRFLPNIIKKNQHTISDVDIRHAHLNDIIDVNQDWGIMHEDLYDPENQIMIRRDGVNLVFLNAKGRVVTDCFIYPSFHQKSSEPKYFVEVENSIINRLMFMLNMYKLGAKVDFQTKQLNSYYLYHDSLEYDEFLDFLQASYFLTFNPLEALNKCKEFIDDEVLVNSKLAGNLVGLAIDNRIPNFGIKLITNGLIDDSFFSDSFKAKFPIKITPESDYKQRRYLNGLYESPDSPKDFQLLPFDMNIDYINGMSADKGCYVGQELTSRTYNSGKLGKRIVPCQFFEINDDNLSQIDELEELVANVNDPVNKYLSTLSEVEKLQITPLFENKEEVKDELVSSPFGNMKKRKLHTGKLLSVQDNLGFILLHLKNINVKYFKVEIPGLETRYIGMKVLKPNWWPEDDEL